MIDCQYGIAKKYMHFSINFCGTCRIDHDIHKFFSSILWCDIKSFMLYMSTNLGGLYTSLTRKNKSNRYRKEIELSFLADIFLEWFLYIRYPPTKEFAKRITVDPWTEEDWNESCNVYLSVIYIIYTFSKHKMYFQIYLDIDKGQI